MIHAMGKSSVIREENFIMKFFLITLCYCLISLCGAEDIVRIKPRPYSYYRTHNQSSTPSQYVAYRNKTSSTKIIQTSIHSLTLNLNRILSRCYASEGNILFSPINILMTLSTLMLGAGGRTERELASAIGPGLMDNSLNRYTNITDDDLLDRESANEKENEHEIDENTSISEYHQTMGRLMRNLINTQSPSSAVVEVANGLFIENEYPVKDKYKTDSMKIYQTEVLNMNFSGDGFASANQINQWISRKTHGKIKDVISPPVNPVTKVIFASALYFNGNWEHPFQEKITKWQSFYLGAEGKYGKEGSVQTEMMVNQAKIPAYENKQKGFQAIGMPYKGGDFIMYVILPRLKTSLKELMCRLKPEDIETVISKSQTAEVFYVIPKMKLEHESNLRDVLLQVNASSMFDPQTANFSNLAEDDGIYVSDVLHKVNIEMNERGTIAAATTVVSMNRGGYVNFRADRPFLFFIYNVRVGIITFWGSIRKPVPFRKVN